MAKSTDFFVPPPVKGLNYNELLAKDSEYALQLDCLIPRGNNLEGFPGVTGVYISPASPKTLIPYRAGNKSFVASDTGIYDVPGSVSLIALTAGVGHSIEVSTGAGNYVLFFNATDTPKIYNGAAWADAAITGPTSPATLMGGTVYRHRMILIDGAASAGLGFWYLAPDAISGAAKFYNAGSIFTRGGRICSIAPLSIDGGLGPDDQLAVYTTGGEVAVFSGSDPGSSDWQVVGVYYLGTPASRLLIRPKVMAKVGGDVYVFTQNGIFSLRQAMSGAQQGLGVRSLSANIDKTLVPYIKFLNSAGGAALYVLPNLGILIASVQRDLSTNSITGISNSSAAWGMDLASGAWFRLPSLITIDRSIGAMWDWIEVPSVFTAGLLEIQALGRDSGTAAVLRMTFGPGNTSWPVASGAGNPWAIRTPYLIKGLYGSQILQYKPLFIHSQLPGIGRTLISAYSFTAGLAYNLSDDYQTATVGAGATSNFWRDSMGLEYVAGPQPTQGKYSRSWLTSAANSEFESFSAYFNGTFPTDLTTPTAFKYLGMMVRADPSAPGGG